MSYSILTRRPVSVIATDTGKERFIGKRAQISAKDTRNHHNELPERSRHRLWVCLTYGSNLHLLEFNGKFSKSQLLSVSSMLGFRLPLDRSSVNRVSVFEFVCLYCLNKIFVVKFQIFFW